MQDSKHSVPFVPILQDQGAASEDGTLGPQFTWIKSDSAWKRLGYLDFFKNRANSSDVQKIISELDFKKHDVLIFTYGDAGNNGASVKLEKILADGKTRFVVNRKDADPNLRQAQVMSHPMQFVRIDKGLKSQSLEFQVNGKPGQFTVHIEE